MFRALMTSAMPQLDSEDRIFHIGHDDRNVRAINCTRRAGFAAMAARTSTPASKRHHHTCTAAVRRKAIDPDRATLKSAPRETNG
jgi:hypothetical protein